MEGQGYVGTSDHIAELPYRNCLLCTHCAKHPASASHKHDKPQSYRNLQPLRLFGMFWPRDSPLSCWASPRLVSPFWFPPPGISCLLPLWLVVPSCGAHWKVSCFEALASNPFPSFKLSEHHPNKAGGATATLWSLFSHHWWQNALNSLQSLKWGWVLS